MSETKKISKAKTKKIEAVAQLKDKLGKAKAVFFTNYTGLTHPQLETLRKSLKKVQAEFTVMKNTLIKIAMKSCGAGSRSAGQFSNLPVRQAGETMKQLEEKLVNATAALLAFGDPIEAIKALAAFIKTTQLPKIKIGIFEGNIAKEADFLKLSTIPSREILLATLAGRLQSPISGLHYALSWNMRKLVIALNNVKNKK